MDHSCPPAAPIPQGRGALSVRRAGYVPDAVEPRETDALDWYFRARRGEVVCPARARDLDLATAARTFGAARFEALYRLWQHRGVDALWTMQSPILRDQLQRGRGRVEFAELRQQYLQLTPFVGRAHPVEDGFPEGDNLTTA